MFSSLSEKITETFKKLKGQGRISESSLNDALREIRIALLEADVALSTTKDFIENIKKKALGQEVLNSGRLSEFPANSKVDANRAECKAY